MKKQKARTSRDQAHTPKSPKGMGDYQGKAIRNPVGRVRDSMIVNTITPKKLKTPPKSLA